MTRPEAVIIVARAFCKAFGACPCAKVGVRSPGLIAPHCHAHIVYQPEAIKAVADLERGGMVFEKMPPFGVIVEAPPVDGKIDEVHL